MDSDVEMFAQSVSQRPATGGEGPPPRKTPRSRGGTRPRETEEEATIRRQHDAQRMARFRARRKKALDERLAAVDSSQSNPPREESDSDRRGVGEASDPETEGKYAELLAIIERLGRDVRLSYAGSRSSAERLKSGIARARSLVRDCLVRTRINLRH